MLRFVARELKTAPVLIYGTFREAAAPDYKAPTSTAA
jgi:hypothetical protein